MHCQICELPREHPFLPGGYRLMLEMGTVDLDPGDPETGPAPDVQVVPITVGVRNPAGEPIGTGKWYDDEHEYRFGKEGASLYDQVDRWMRTWDPDNRNELIGYLHEEGLV